MGLERDPEVMRFLNGGRIAGDGHEHTDTAFLRPRGTEPYVWTALLKANAAFVGWFSLLPVSEGVAELGYRLRRVHWGQGLASEGATALLQWGFSSGRHDKIVASTMAVNHASRRVLERIGLSLVRTVHLDWPDPIPGSEKGEVEYELTRSQWNGQRASVDDVAQDYGV